MPPTRQTKPPASTRESVWFVVLWHTPNNGKTESVKYLFEGGEAIGFVFHNNDPSGFTNPRYFTKNLQGDIVSIYHHDYSHRVTYSYDAWGNPSVVSGVDGSQYAWLLGYRGYQYDKETGLYYCQSRYYNPRVARWLSGDKYFDAEYSETPLTSNVWAYAENNPVNLGDHDGESATAIILGLIAVGALLTAGGCAAQSKEPPPAKNTTTSTTTTTAPKATTTSPGIKSTKAYKNLYKKISNKELKSTADLLKRPEVEIVARVIYGENVSNVAEQNAFGLVIMNRKAKGGEFDNKSYKSIVTQGNGSHFNALKSSNARKANNKNGAKWDNAKHVAVLICLNKRSEITNSLKVSKTQTHFLAIGSNSWKESYKGKLKHGGIIKRSGKEWLSFNTTRKNPATNKNETAYFEMTGKITGKDSVFFGYDQSSYIFK